ncbi:MAG: hypothetical protein Q9171_001279 [Xanthocarpia ochracea]
MEHAAFHVVYVDKRISVNLDGTYLQKAASGSLAGADWSLQADRRPNGFQQTSSEIALVQDNLRNLLANFNGAQMALEARRADDRPPYARCTPTPDQSSSKNQSTASIEKQANPPRRSNLLRAIASQIALADSSMLIMPVAFIQSQEDDVHAARQQQSARDEPLLPPELLRCLDDGAVDVVFTPLSFDRIRSIASQSYRQRKDRSKKRASSQEIKKSRKRSWVGFDDRKPYAYLREEMYVSTTCEATVSILDTCTDVE